MNFNLMKNHFPIFYEHKNSKLNLFSSISKNSNFRVLQKGRCQKKKDRKKKMTERSGWPRHGCIEPFLMLSHTKNLA